MLGICNLEALTPSLIVVAEIYVVERVLDWGEFFAENDLPLKMLSVENTELCFCSIKNNRRDKHKNSTSFLTIFCLIYENRD